MTRSREIRRILVALDQSADSLAALRESAALAARVGAELTGVFVLDADLLRLAALPVAAETGLTSAARRTIDPQAMERALMLQAREAKAALEAAARLHDVQSAFRFARGDVAAELLAAAADMDLIAMGAMGHMGVTGRRLGSTVRHLTAEATCSVLLMTPQARTGDRIVVVSERSSGTARALDAALELARQGALDLEVLLHGAAEEVRTVRALAEERLRTERIATTWTEVGGENGSLAQWLAGHGCGLLVVPHDSPAWRRAAELLDAAGCPVLIAK